MCSGVMPWQHGSSLSLILACCGTSTSVVDAGSEPLNTTVCYAGMSCDMRCASIPQVASLCCTGNFQLAACSWRCNRALRGAKSPWVGITC